MSVKDSLNRWGAEYLRLRLKADIPEGVEITFEENVPSPHYCETCGPDPYTTTITIGGISTEYYGSLGDIIQDILLFEKEEES